jgi:urease subunit gamma/beta
MAAMRLTAWEEERLLIFTAAELARRHRDRGLRLNAPEAIALICDTVLESARADATYEAVEAAGHAAVGPDDVLPGVRELVDEVRIEVLMGDGTRLIVLLDPIGRPGEAPAADGPGAIVPATSAPIAAGRSAAETRELVVTSHSTRVIRVSSHYPFHRVNPRLDFDRDAARGYRLDLPAGETERWAPGETKTVRITPFRGDRESGA